MFRWIAIPAILCGVLAGAVGPAHGAVLTLEPAFWFAPGLGGVGNVVVSPDGRHVYATSGRAAIPDDGPTVVAMARDAGGALSFVQVYSEGPAPGPLCGAAALAVSPDGRHVYVVASCARRIRIFARDETSGMLAPLGAVDHEDGRIDGLDGWFQVGLSPDGTSLYTVEGNGSTLGLFRRDPDSGALAWVAGTRVDGVPSNGFPIGAIAVSPDGRNLYVPVAAGASSALHVFARDTATGAVLESEVQHDGVNQFTSVANFLGAAVTADGRSVYTGFTSDLERVIPVFDRDAGSGKLTLVQANPIAPSIGTGTIAISPDGSFVYLGGDYELAVLRRDSATGQLALVETHDHTFGTIDGLYLIGDGLGGMGVAVSPDGRDVYTAAGNDGAIGHLRRACGDGRIDPGEACDDGNGRDGDGCSAVCAVEPCFDCAGEPSTCVPDDARSCDDGNPCTTGDHCQGGVCTGSAANDGQHCDDGDACTADDRCGDGACHGRAPLACGPCETCDRRFGCVGFLAGTCDESPEVGPYGSLELTDADPARPALRWRWAAPASSPLHDFGTPGRDPEARYTLCVYDRDGIPFGARRAATVAALEIPDGGGCGRGRCWRTLASGTRLRYRDAAANADGVTRLLVRNARDQTPSILLDAEGTRLAFRTPPLTLPATVQLTTPSGACWRADYQAFVRTNSTQAFRARGGLERPCRGRGCYE